MFLVNSRFPLVCATLQSSRSKSHHPTRVLFIPKLQRQFAEFLNHSSPTRLSLLDLSTCVGLGYGQHENSLEAFLGSIGSVTHPKRGGIMPQTKRARIYQDPVLHTYPRTTNAWAHLPSCVTPLLTASSWVNSPENWQPLSNNKLVRTFPHRYWNINQLCIDYAFRPRLSSRLTLGGRTFPRNPWIFGGGDSHSSFATHANIRTRPNSTTGSPTASSQDRRSATTQQTPKNLLHPQLRLWT